MNTFLYLYAGHNNFLTIIMEQGGIGFEFETP